MTQIETIGFLGAAARRRARWDVALVSSLAAIGSRWSAIERFGITTPFQSREWLESWYAGAESRGEEPLIVLADDTDGRPAMVLPLVRKPYGDAIIITFADSGVSDYNAPALGPAAPLTPFEARQLWAQIRRRLPSADAIALEKMPATIGQRPNPLVWLPGVGLSALTQSMCPLVAPYDQGRASQRPAAFNESLDVRMKKLKQKAAVRFAAVMDRDEAARVFDAAVRQKAERAHAMGWCDPLSDPVWHDHYKRLAVSCGDGGMTRLLVLYVDDEPAAIIMGFLKGARFFDILTSFDTTRWKRHSLGLQVLDQAMRWMADNGVTQYDLTIGAEHYKTDFGPTVAPLYELIEARSLRGMPAMVSARLKSELRRSPTALRWAKKIVRRTA